MEIYLPRGDVKALIVVLNIIYSRFDKVPIKVDPQVLTEIAILVLNAFDRDGDLTLMLSSASGKWIKAINFKESKHRDRRCDCGSTDQQVWRDGYLNLFWRPRYLKGNFVWRLCSRRAPQKVTHVGLL